jgi:hypothetical protein
VPVVPYSRFRTSLEEPALIAMAEHWNAMRGERSMPAWRDIDPVAIKQYLPIVWAWRWDTGLDTFVGRLAGEQIIAVLGINIRGRRIEECFPPTVLQAVIARYRRVMVEPAFMHSAGKVYHTVGGEGWGERIVLPLASDGVNGDGIIGATVYRLGIQPRAGEASIDYVNQTNDFFPLK